MLVLSRKLGEKIVIGDGIVVTVVKIDRTQVRLGIEAPADVPIYREEIAPKPNQGQHAQEARPDERPCTPGSPLKRHTHRGRKGGYV